jgi:hypothetical protein
MSEETLEQIHDMDEDFLSIAGQITIQDQPFGAMYPVIQWVNGDMKAKAIGGISYTGGFFVSAEQGLDLPGWTPYTLVTRSGQEIVGFSCRDLTLTPIAFRRSWLVRRDEAGLPIRLPWNGYAEGTKYDYKKSPRGRGQLLAKIKTSDGWLADPVIITFSGMVAASVFSQGRTRGIVPAFGQIVVNQASRIAASKGNQKRYPLCAFTLDIGADRDGNGLPIFADVGKGDAKSKVTLPKWLNRPSGVVATSEINKRFVGASQFDINQRIYNEAGEWTRAWSAEALIEALKRNAPGNLDLSHLLAADDEDEEEKGKGALPGDDENVF